MLEDKQIIEVQRLFVEHLPRLRRFVLSLLPNRGEADDVIQETFLTVVAKADRFELGTNFGAWVCAIARFKVLEHFAETRQRPHPLSKTVIDLLVAEAAEEGKDDTDLRLSSALSNCLKRLSPKWRHMIELRYNEERMPADIATEMGWSTNAVHVALSKARSKLRQCVAQSIR